jgi:O-antigen ligase
MNKLTTAALFFLAAGILTSVTVLSVYQILFAVPLIYYSWVSISKKDIALPKSSYWLLGFAVLSALTILLNLDIIPKPGRNLGKIKYFIFGVGGIFVLRAWLIETTSKVKSFLIDVFLVSIIVAGIYSIGQYAMTGVRSKTLTDTMRYGYGSAMLLLSLLSAILHSDKFQGLLRKKLAICAFAIGLLGMYFTFTRGAILGLLSGLPFVAYYYKPKFGLIAGGLVVLIIGILGGFYLFGNIQNPEAPRLLVSKENGSDHIRRSQWQAAMIAVKEKPLLGYGFSNFHSQVKRIKIENDLDAKDYDDAHAHNLFLEIAAGTGLLGLALFLGWIICWALEMFKAPLLTRALVIPFCVAWIVSSQFEVTFDANNAAMIFFLYPLSQLKRYV